ncbi:MAG: polynucleotide adenylyltransferase PcnB [Deltaproteobacteria bacterium]|nr:polynucleotide adenylyltransferase PcnB [Deltaproteobacteria bacterium]
MDPDTYDFHVPGKNLDTDALKVVNRLRRFGYETYLVGGCVRDLLAGIKPKDFDVATSATPEQVKKLFRNSWLIGRRFRLAHIVFGRDKKIIEVATFRAKPFKLDCSSSKTEKDLLIKEDNVFGTPREDANRRDFTINALFYDHVDSRIIDYVGGYKDIENGILRSIGDPRIRFSEDPVRMIRACRYSAKLEFEIDPGVKDAMIQVCEHLRKASPSRLMEELFKILESGVSRRTFEYLLEHGVLRSLSRSLAKFMQESQTGEKSTYTPGWSHLGALDALVSRRPKLPSRAVQLATLVIPMARSIARKRMASHDCSTRAAMMYGTDMVLSALMVNFRLIKKDSERIRQIGIAQERLLPSVPHIRPSPPSRLLGRKYFQDSLLFMYIDCVAKGTGWNQYARWRALSLAARSNLPPVPPWIPIKTEETLPGGGDRKKKTKRRIRKRKPGIRIEN